MAGGTIGNTDRRNAPGAKVGQPPSGFNHATHPRLPARVRLARGTWLRSTVSICPPGLDADLLLHADACHHHELRPARASDRGARWSIPEHGADLPAELQPGPRSHGGFTTTLQAKDGPYGPWRLAWLESILRSPPTSSPAERKRSVPMPSEPDDRTSACRSIRRTPANSSPAAACSSSPTPCTPAPPAGPLRGRRPVLRRRGPPDVWSTVTAMQVIAVGGNRDNPADATRLGDLQAKKKKRRTEAESNELAALQDQPMMLVLTDEHPRPAGLVARAADVAGCRFQDVVRRATRASDSSTAWLATC